MAKPILLLNALVLFLTQTDGFTSGLLRRYLMYNPADLSTVIGYKNHSIHDMTSLVNEASSNAHGGQQSASYNVPNFPAMGSNSGQLQSGGSSSSGSSSGTASGSGSASFAGTNQWRCDSHVIAQCDPQCLDVDPKDGCAFCITGCTQGTGGSGQLGSNSGTSSQSGSGTGNPQVSQPGSGSQSGSSVGTPGTSGSGNGSPSGTPASSPFGSTGNQPGSGSQSGTSGGTSGGNSTGSGSLSGTPAGSPFGGQMSSGLSQSSGTLSGSGSQANQPGTVGQSAGTLTGTSGQGSPPGGALGQLPSGLAGTGSQGQGSAGTSGATPAPSCSYYPPNCPNVYTKLENGCLVCTLLQQLNLVPSTQGPQTTTAIATRTAQPAGTVTTVTCAPRRCVAPCNVGIVLGTDGCPRCKCPDYT